jgi:hypothetical protein
LASRNTNTRLGGRRSRAEPWHRQERAARGQLVRYLWASKERLPEDLQSLVCECGSRYVAAALEISRSPSTIPQNQYLVLSLSIFVLDADLGARQDEWNAQWQQQKKW